MAKTTFQYRDHDIIQILKISRSPRFANTLGYTVYRSGVAVHFPNSMLEAVRWIDKAAWNNTGA